MINNKQKGMSGEKIAETYLKNNHYRILNKNFKTEVGEIDIIATDEKTLVFLEVKSRFNEDYGMPAEAVTYHKRCKINQVASQYIKKFRLYGVAVRFDVIEVYLKDNRVNHIVNAFDSYLRY